MRKGVVLMLWLVLLALVVCNCGGGGSPSDVVKAFYTAGNKGDYTKAESCLLTETKMALRGGAGAFGGDFKSLMDKATKNRSIERIEIVNEKVYEGSAAGVDFTIYFKDGSRRNSLLGLIKEGGTWKIQVFMGQ